MKKNKRVLSILITLAMALGLLAAMPLTAYAAAPSNPVPDVIWDFTVVDASGSGTGWSWDQPSKTLTLNNFTLASGAEYVLRLPGDSTIVLTGTNSITNTRTSSGFSIGILVSSEGGLTINGNGSLTITGGASNTSAGPGIQLPGADLKVGGDADVTAVGGTRSSSIGVMFGVGGTITMAGNGRLTAIGNSRAISRDYTVPNGYRYYVSTTTAPSATPLTGDGFSTIIDSTYKYAKFEYVTPVLSLSASSWSPAAAAGSTGVNVTSNLYWVASSDAASWLTATPAGAMGDGSFTINATENLGTTARSGTITVMGGGITRTVAVTQAGAAPTLDLSASSWNPTGAASSTSVTVTSNTSWAVSSDAAAWLTASPTSGSNNGSFTINATENTGTAARSGTITVMGGGITRTVAVTQAGAVPATTDVTELDSATKIYKGFTKGKTIKYFEDLKAEYPDLTFTAAANKMFTMDANGKITFKKSFASLINGKVAVTVSSIHAPSVLKTITVTVRWAWWEYPMVILGFGWLWI